MSDPFGGLVNAVSEMEAAVQTAASSGQHYKVEPAAVKQAIRHYRRLYEEMEEDLPYIEAIKWTKAPVQDGPSHTQAAALLQFGQEIGSAHNRQLKYLGEEIRKLQKSLDDYEKQEEQTAEGLRGQM
jgi:gas vesicle protein